MNSKTILSIILTLPLAAASCTKEESEPAASGSGSASSSDYPLTTCVVSGEELGGMGEPVEYDYQGTLVKFCCKSCIPKFEADPEKYVAKLR